MRDLESMARGWSLGLAVVLAGCDGDNKGTASATDTTGSPMTTGESTTDDSTTGTSTTGTSTTTGTVTTDDPPTTGTNPMPCNDFDEDIQFSPDLQDLLDQLNVFPEGATLHYLSGGATELDLEFAYAGGKIHQSGTECPETGTSGTLDMEARSRRPVFRGR